MAVAPSVWQNVGTVAGPLIQGAGSAVSSSQVANANANAAAGVNAAGAHSAGLLDPYAAAGSSAEDQLLALYGVKGNPAQAAAQANFENTPGYQFTRDQGDRAIQRQASATGGEFSSATLGALSNYNTGLAQSTYQNYIQNLFGLVNPGVAAAGASGSQGIQAATQSGKFQVGQGEARASGVQGVSGALTNALSNPAVTSALRSLFGNGGGNGAGSAAAAAAARLFGSGNPMDSSNWDTSSYNGINPDGTLTQDPNNPYFYNPANDPNSELNTMQAPSFDDSVFGDNPSYYGDSGSGGFNPAGGEAATAGVGNAPSVGFSGSAETSNPPSAASTPTGSGVTDALGAASSALNIYQGIQRGGVSGYGSAAVNAASLANRTGLTSIPYVGPAGNVLGIYNGVRSGTGIGYANAAVNAAQLYGAASAADVAAGGSGFAGGAAAGAAGLAAAAPLALVAWAASRPNSGTGLSASYFSGLAKTLNAGPGTGGKSLSDIKQYTAYEGARSELMQLLTGGGGEKAYQGMPFTSKQLAQWGITPQEIVISNPTNMAKAGAAGAAAAAAAGIPEFSTPSAQHK